MQWRDQDVGHGDTVMGDRGLWEMKGDKVTKAEEMKGDKVTKERQGDKHI